MDKESEKKKWQRGNGVYCSLIMLVVISVSPSQQGATGNVETRGDVWRGRRGPGVLCQTHGADWGQLNDAWQRLCSSFTMLLPFLHACHHYCDKPPCSHSDLPPDLCVGFFWHRFWLKTRDDIFLGMLFGTFETFEKCVRVVLCALAEEEEFRLSAELKSLVQFIGCHLFVLHSLSQPSFRPL